MKKTLQILPFIFFLLIISACQEVIDLELRNSDPVPVIEGNITDKPGPHVVRITRSLNYDQTNYFPPVTDALVKISDQNGYSEVLSEVSPGIYQSSGFSGVPGNTYTLLVETEGKQYQAESFLPQPVAIDTILVDSITFGQSSNLYTRVKFMDPPVANWYRVVQIINGDTLKTINLAIDVNRNGQEMSVDIFSDMEPPLEYGDTVTMILQGIDESVFNYLRELVDVMNNASQSASPANPQSNIKGGSLGYFSARSERSQTIVVK